MKQKVNARVFDLFITSKCTLKCKLCMPGMPYVAYKRHVPLTELIHYMNSFFEIWDSATRLNLIGGEPLSHPDVFQILEAALSYQSKIENYRITTNGTVLPKEDFLRLAYDNNVFFVISHYGDLSRNADRLVEQLELHKIAYRVDKYFGENMYFGGWVDLGGDEDRRYTEEELQKKYWACACRADNFHAVYEGKVFQCARAVHLYAANGMLPEANEYIDLLDEQLSTEEKRAIAVGMYSGPIKACRYCDSFNEKETKRVLPAEQIQ